MNKEIYGEGGEKPHDIEIEPVEPEGENMQDYWNSFVLPSRFKKIFSGLMQPVQNEK